MVECSVTTWNVSVRFWFIIYKTILEKSIIIYKKEYSLGVKR